MSVVGRKVPNADKINGYLLLNKSSFFEHFNAGLPPSEQFRDGDDEPDIKTLQ